MTKKEWKAKAERLERRCAVLVGVIERMSEDAETAAARLFNHQQRVHAARGLIRKWDGE